VKIRIAGPLAGPGPHGQIESWGPGQVVEVDDDDEAAVAWAKGWAKGPYGELIEIDKPAPDAKAKPAAQGPKPAPPKR